MGRDDLDEHKSDVGTVVKELDYIHKHAVNVNTVKKAGETKKTLEEWVKHLDNEYGKPDR